MNEAAASAAPKPTPEPATKPTAKPGAAAYGRWTAVASSAVVAALLLGLALPRTVAAWAGMNGAELYHRVSYNQKVPDADLDAVIAGLKYAVTWVPSNQRYKELAGLEERRFWSLPSTDGRGAQVRRDAEAHAELAVAANPLDGDSNLRLAILRQWRGAPLRDIAAPLLQSIDSAPHPRRLWPWRTARLFTVLPVLTREEQQIVDVQLRTVWRLAPDLRGLMIAAAKSARQEQALVRALSSEPGAAAELERAGITG